MKVHKDIFNRIIALEHLFSSWEGFKRGKGSRTDVQEFEWKLEENTFALHRELESRTYTHSPYSAFFICDPKQRHIHKATVRDRILHHAVFSILNPIFEPSFISHSFSCRDGKGTHKAVDALEKMLRKVSHNAHEPCFVLQCDIHKFFDSVDHNILLNILGKRIKDEDAMWLLKDIVGSFKSARFTPATKGVPIGNLTSQLFANVYLNELDQFIKHTLRVQNYVRYTDDFAIVSNDPEYLRSLIQPIRAFLQERLCLDLHPRKISMRRYRQGIDFLGYVLLPHCRVVRTRTKQRMFRKLHLRAIAFKNGTGSKESVEQSLHSYLGVLSHANSYRLSDRLKNEYWFWLSE